MFYKLITSMTRAQKGHVLMALDLFWLIAAFALAQIVLTNGGVSISELWSSMWYLLFFVPLAATVIHMFGLHRIKLNAYGMDDIASTITMAGMFGLVGLFMTLVSGPKSSVDAPTLVVFCLLFSVMSVYGRILLRKVVLRIYSSEKKRKRVLIYGAGQTGQQLAAALQTDDEFEAACFVDDNPALQKLSVAGMRVHPPESIPMLVKRVGIERIILAMPSVEQSVRIHLAKRLSTLNCEVLALPSFADMVLRGEEAPRIAPVELSSLLGRDALESDLPAASSAYQNRRILVTGGGGSIGSELCRQIIGCNPSELVVMDHSEFALYKVVKELEGISAGIKVVPVLGSVTQPELVRDTLITHQIDVVFHAAAYKHVNLVETNCFEGFRNNVLGTRVVAEEAIRAGASRFILVSTDKAVRPTSMMGSTKRMAELVVQDLATRSQTTKLSMVRFGNVLGSSGSVIPLFEEQIRNSGPVTVTDPEVTRYFMTRSEAVRLVLLAGSFSRGGDVFVLDMGKPVSILSVARQMIQASGFSVRDETNPNGDIPILFTGLQPGEKMHEELLIGSDMLTTPHPKILRAQEKYWSELEIANALQDLRKSIDSRDSELLRATVLRWVESADSESEILTVVGES
ncbi:nucleoside-diphosphate sugar epimerase/dehydratase [Shimia sp.]|uniref:polysaccharide biosynthesis protein n=1 Tax=Shimia sp. TaxID=1954381 RepID=UPI003299446D